MIYLVTGAGGFVGSHLTQSLLDRGETVRALVHYNGAGRIGHLEKIPAPLHRNLDIRAGDVTDPFFVRELVAGCDTVFHLAALIAIPYSYIAPASYVQTNVGGTLNILEACRAAGVQRLLVTSTSEVYGTARYEPIDENHPLQAQSPYAASKIGADKLAESYFRSFDLPVTIARPFNTFGPRQSARAVIPTIAAQIVAGSPQIELGALWPQRDLMFVSDTIAGFLALAQKPVALGEAVNLGTGRTISIGELAQMMITLSGRDIPIDAAAERQRPAKSEVGLLLCDASKARDLVGWQPRVTLEAGLQKVMDYVAENGAEFRPGEYQR